MVFNSLVFAVFLVIVLPAVLLLNRSPALRNKLLLAASYFFYGWWDWRFLGLFALTTLVDYSCSRGMMQADELADGDRRRRGLMLISVLTNLTILGFFKYWGFFADSLQQALASLNVDVELPLLHVVLPVGISFYTFQSMSYTIDVYRRAIPAESNLITFAAYLSFFPQLVAGPIERASHLIPQFRVSRPLTLEGFYQGCYQVGWGLFKKVVIADNVAGIADTLFASQTPGGLDVILGVTAFSIQVYADFSGYSDIACGLARCMGFDLMANFRQPFFATNPSDFWRRWHISLSTWLRDYLYIPLGGNRSGNTRTNLNLMVTMILGGLWHGAAWTFVAWGTYHGLLLVAHRMLSPFLIRWVNPKSGPMQVIWFGIRWSTFFMLSSLGWLLFRAESAAQVFQFLSNLASNPLIRNTLTSETDLIGLFAAIGVLFVADLFHERTGDQLAVFRLPTLVRAVLYAAMIMAFLVLGNFGSDSFIYFQF